MKLKFTRSGGFMGGFPLEKETDAQNLSPDLQTLAQSLIDNAQTLKALPKNETLRDGFQYAFELKPEGKRAIKLRFDDSNLPADLQPLLDHLLAL